MARALRHFAAGARALSDQLWSVAETSARLEPVFGSPPHSSTLLRVGEGWVLRFRGRWFVLNDRLGLRDLTVLLRHPRVPFPPRAFWPRPWADADYEYWAERLRSAVPPPIAPLTPVDLKSALHTIRKRFATTLRAIARFDPECAQLLRRALRIGSEVSLVLPLGQTWTTRRSPST